MKVVFHERFFEEYAYDPAADKGRLDVAYNLLKNKYEIINPKPCTDNDLLLVHKPQHINKVKDDMQIYEVGSLAVGAAICASEYAIKSEMAFALCRPPGHHASPNVHWGFCYFNNIAIAVQKLLKSNHIKKAIIIDFDLHFGDGTYRQFIDSNEVDYYFILGREPEEFIKNLEDYLKDKTCDLLAVSAGFDRHEYDWGSMLPTSTYKLLGQILGNFAKQQCEGRLFAVLEGGYTPTPLGESILAFLEGLEDLV
ncbi:Deacetylase [Candidatus Syntrophocurvum alkaliphilum]|uniref:Deacetylase n=1 Tax=Candidatus Syntrophocurvum alkaliphilum TaxID=2293317 RepID=A0A6I6D905_9FIRM|nr:histone deacetylase family protein [Candidatus Syntrophocurvum alkaliphilum]QGT99345.1 Deacetylase [Candidatus Syntrophocurvum alkaliphilum]